MKDSSGLFLFVGLVPLLCSFTALLLYSFTALLLYSFTAPLHHCIMRDSESLNILSLSYYRHARGLTIIAPPPHSA